MKKDYNLYIVSGTFSNGGTLNFYYDSGASDVSIPYDFYIKLRKTGVIKDSNLLGNMKVILANGSEVDALGFVIPYLKVGDVVVKNICGSTTKGNSPALLGQTFQRKFKSITINNLTNELILSL